MKFTSLSSPSRLSTYARRPNQSAPSHNIFSMTSLVPFAVVAITCVAAAAGGAAEGVGGGGEGLAMQHSAAAAKAATHAQQQQPEFHGGHPWERLPFGDIMTVDASNRFRADVEEVGNRPFPYMYILDPDMSIGDVILFIVAVVGITLTRLALSGAVHPRLSTLPCLFKTVFKRKTVPGETVAQRDRRVNKLAENLWYMFWHSTSFLWGFAILYIDSLSSDHPGWSRYIFSSQDPTWFWFYTQEEMKQHGGVGWWPFLRTSSYVRLFYLINLAFWSSCAFYIMVETRRSDFYVMFTHHVATVLLISISYVCGHWRVGLLTLQLHDVADVPLYMAKALHGMKLAQPLIAQVTFAIFAATFFLARLVFFPWFLVRRCADIWLMRVHTRAAIFQLRELPGGFLLPGALCLLQVLHVWWYALIIRMVFRQIRDRHLEHDIRSDDGDSSDVGDVAALEGEGPPQQQQQQHDKTKSDKTGTTRDRSSGSGNAAAAVDGDELRSQSGDIRGLNKRRKAG
eukprot:GHVU01010923.1.p1 GENE.GHVU01010923.1~~GHVU01010923.1.p1  ORF type:complete len:512 (-),score=65.46 GHVU01010923.1:749-2284(-)